MNKDLFNNVNIEAVKVGRVLKTKVDFWQQNKKLLTNNSAEYAKFCQYYNYQKSISKQLINLINLVVLNNQKKLNDALLHLSNELQEIK